MKKSNTRLGELERQISTDDIGPFLGLLPGNNWTEEKEAEAIRQHPECKHYWRMLSNRLPYPHGSKALTSADSQPGKWIYVDPPEDP